MTLCHILPENRGWVNRISHKTAFNSETTVLEHSVIWRTPLLQLGLDPLLTVVIVPVRVTSMAKMELFDHLDVHKQKTDVKLNY